MPYLTPAYDWTARAEDGFADTAAMEENLQAAAPGVTLSLAPGLQENIRKATSNKLKARAEVKLCSSPRELAALGEPEADIVTTASILKKLSHKHGLSNEEIFKVVESLDNPLFVINGDDGRYVFLLDMQAKTTMEKTRPSSPPCR